MDLPMTPVTEKLSEEYALIQEEIPTPVPQLFIDVNLGEEMEAQRIVVYPGNTPSQLARDFCDLHNLDEETRENLQELLAS